MDRQRSLITQRVSTKLRRPQKSKGGKGATKESDKMATVATNNADRQRAVVEHGSSEGARGGKGGRKGKGTGDRKGRGVRKAK